MDLLTGVLAFFPWPAASLRFQPTKRPQIATQKPKSKPSLPRPTPPRPVTSPPEDTTPANESVRSVVKTTLADWTGTGDDDDVNGFYGAEKRQRGGRKKRKKNREESHVPQNWDDIYDPSRPNNYEEYKNSDEKIREVREWKDRLYAHRMARKHTSDLESDDEDLRRPQMSSKYSKPYQESPAELQQINLPHLPCHLPLRRTLISKLH